MTMFGLLESKKTALFVGTAAIGFCFCLLAHVDVVRSTENQETGESEPKEGVIILDETPDQMKVGVAKEKPTWDPKGYLLFCPCMGRFGNQGEHYLGTLAFAKAIDRTLVLAPFRTNKNAPFSEWFLVEPLKEYHRVILMEDFMEYLAPEHWPEGKRRGYCYMPVKSDNECDLKKGNPFGPFWDGYSINFDETTKFELPIYAEDGNEHKNQGLRAAWDARFPLSEHPVIALRGAPAPFPMLEPNRQIQQYFHWAPGIFAEAKGYMDEMFKGEKYVAVHLRTGIDWERACEHVEGTRRYMASEQCHTPDVEAVSKQMCYPSESHVVKHARNAIKKIGAKHLFIATDKHSYKDKFEKDLKSKGVTVHHLNPDIPQIDLIIMGQADFFIGNCVSSFTSWVKRERDARGRPSTFWSRKLDDHMKPLGKMVEYKRQ